MSLFNRNNKGDAKPEGDTPLDTADAPAGETPPMKPFSAKAAPAAQPAAASQRASFRPEPPKRPLDISGQRRSSDRARSGSEGTDSKKLIVGREISLNGEISACDNLVVEGTVQASLSDGDHIEIAETGLYKGTATVREAVIRGRFEGELTAQRCIVSEKGLITGKLTYGTLEMEAGGIIKGTLALIGDEEVAG